MKALVQAQQVSPSILKAWSAGSQLCPSGSITWEPF